MKKGILGKKVGMTQIFDESGKVIPVTVIEAGPCVVVQMKTVQNDGYNAIKVGFDEKKVRVIDVKKYEVKRKEDGKLKTEQKESKKYNVSRALKGAFDKVKVPFQRFVKELRLEDTASFEVGQELKADIFNSGEKVDVTGVSKGKGMQGVIKRHNASRGPMSHGSMYHRRPGSMGASSNPSRVFKNKKLPGHMGNEKITVQNLDVVKVDAEKNLLLIRGAIPGPKGGYVIIKDSVKVNK